MSIEHLVFNQGPKRVGPFSHAVKAGDFLFVTGQMPTLPNDSSKLIDGGISNQTHQVMKNLISVLKEANSSLKKVVFVRIYLINFDDYEIMNSIYKSYFDHLRRFLFHPHCFYLKKSHSNLSRRQTLQNHYI